METVDIPVCAFNNHVVIYWRWCAFRFYQRNQYMCADFNRDFARQELDIQFNSLGLCTYDSYSSKIIACK